MKWCGECPASQEQVHGVKGQRRHGAEEPRWKGAKVYCAEVHGIRCTV